MKNFIFAFIAFLAWVFLTSLIHQKLLNTSSDLKPTDSIINTQNTLPAPINRDTLEIKPIKIDSIVTTPVVKTYLSSTIFYGVNQDKFKEINKIDSLTKVLKMTILNNRDAHIFIEGHTDSIGRADANYLMGLEHASNFKDYLSSHGIDAHKIETSSKGETEPKFDNSILEHRKNRRLEITVKTTNNN